MQFNAEGSAGMPEASDHERRTADGNSGITWRDEQGMRVGSKSDGSGSKMGRRQRASYLDEEVGEDGEDGEWWCGANVEQNDFIMIRVTPVTSLHLFALHAHLRDNAFSILSPMTRPDKENTHPTLPVAGTARCEGHGDATSLQKKRQKALKQLQTRTLWSLTVDCPGDTELVQELRAALAAARRSNSGTNSHDNDEEDSNQTVFRGCGPLAPRSLPELTPDGSEAGVALRDPAPVAFLYIHFNLNNFHCDSPVQIKRNSPKHRVNECSENTCFCLRFHSLVTAFRQLQQWVPIRSTPDDASPRRQSRHIYYKTERGRFAPPPRWGEESDCG
ncbi:hypothetical protein FB45DRAFT_1006641 [Roridomyces roridus]|uniref:Uncharacterized protein n=1 Tax=Roridomyces roridus TaxID=1738132 RepID=A0AAD7BHM6_9AGAR|nr:hypothetical protein FB45DRAFT_1006641 [Roridomyces roridus]